MSKVRRRILIAKGDVHYKIGDIMIKVEDGDIYYAPSQKGVVDATTDEMINKIIDHASWHKSGTVHIKDKEEGRVQIEKGVGEGVDGVRQKIQDVGYQPIMLDTIINIESVPVHKKKIDELDVVLEMGDYDGPIQFNFSMVSGKQILKVSAGENTPVHKVDKKIQKERILDMKQGCLGVESGNADKLLQFVLNKYLGNEKLPSGRRLVIPNDSGICR